MRNYYTSPPNPKHAITFAIVSVVILLLPLFWSPLSEQTLTPLATATPRTVEQVLAASATPEARPTSQISSKSSGLQAPVATDTPSPLAVAAPVEADQVNQRFHDPALEFSGHLRRVVIGLLITTLLIALTFKLGQKHIPSLAKQKPGSFLNILAREAISPTQSLALVKVGSKILLVGLSEQSMATLAEFSEVELENLIPQEAASQSQEPKSLYREVFQHYLSIVPGLGAKK